MIYVHDEVESLKTVQDLPEGEGIYTEVRMADGKKETGRLIRITEFDLVLNDGYYYSMVNDSLTRIESQKILPKEDILILRIW
jgi:hypothetical protein